MSVPCLLVCLFSLSVCFDWLLVWFLCVWCLLVVVCSVLVLGVRGVGRKGAVVERAFEVWEEGQQEGEGPTLDQGKLRMHREGCALEKESMPMGRPPIRYTMPRRPRNAKKTLPWTPSGRESLLHNKLP